jgi:hypothetical protein
MANHDESASCAEKRLARRVETKGVVHIDPNPIQEIY